MKREVRAFVGLGSNIAPRLDHLRCAVFLLKHLPRTEVRRLSPVYETSPVGPRQRNFLNAAAEIVTELDPPRLLAALKKTERELGRRTGTRWGPREIDLDLLVYGDECFRGRDLAVPHPRLNERRFALKPLLDLAPDLRDPASGRKFRSVYRRLTGPGQRIRLYQRIWK